MRKPSVYVLSLALLVALLPAFLRGEDGPRFERFKPGQVCEGLYTALSEGMFTGRTMAENLADTKLLLSNGYKATDPAQAGRKELLAMARDAQYRPLLVDALLADLRRRSDTLEAALAAAARSGKIDEAAQVYDHVVIGAGIHDQILANTVALKNPAVKGLTISDGDGIADNFALAGDVFRINSTNRPTKAGVVPQPGRGNLNEFPNGPIQVPDIDPNKFPPARALSDAATINRATADQDILFRNRVTDVVEKKKSNPESKDWPARYRVEVTNGEGKKNYIYTDRVVSSTGLGTPDIPVRTPAGRKLVADEFQALENKLDADVGLLSFENAIRRANAAASPFEAYRGKDIAVVGSGDSGKVFLEFLLGFAPPAAYKGDVAQLGRFKSIDWVGQSLQDCKDYITKTRTRYADIAGGIKSGNVVGVPERLVDVEKLPSGRYRLTYEDKTSGVRRTAEKDVVVFATGFDSQNFSVFRNVVSKDSKGVPLSARNPLEASDRAPQILDKVPGIEGKKAIARQVEDQDIFLVGPAAGRIVDEGEQAGVTENVASIFATGQRTAKLGDRLAKAGGKKNLKRLDYDANVKIDDRASFRAEVALVGSNSLPARGTMMGDPIYLEAQVRSLFNRYRYGSGSADLTITRARNGNFVMSAAAGAETDVMARELARDPRFMDSLRAVIGEGNPKDTVTFDLKLGSQGKVKEIDTRFAKEGIADAKKLPKVGNADYGRPLPRDYQRELLAEASDGSSARSLASVPERELRDLGAALLKIDAQDIAGARLKTALDRTLAPYADRVYDVEQVNSLLVDAKIPVGQRVQFQLEFAKRLNFEKMNDAQIERFAEFVATLNERSALPFRPLLQEAKLLSALEPYAGKAIDVSDTIGAIRPRGPLGANEGDFVAEYIQRIDLTRLKPAQVAEVERFADEVARFSPLGSSALDDVRANLSRTRQIAEDSKSAVAQGSRVRPDNPDEIGRTAYLKEATAVSNKVGTSSLLERPLPTSLSDLDGVRDGALARGISLEPEQLVDAVEAAADVGTGKLRVATVLAERTEFSDTPVAELRRVIGGILPEVVNAEARDLSAVLLSRVLKTASPGVADKVIAEFPAGSVAKLEQLLRFDLSNPRYRFSEDTLRALERAPGERYEGLRRAAETRRIEEFPSTITQDRKRVADAATSQDVRNIYGRAGSGVDVEGPIEDLDALLAKKFGDKSINFEAALSTRELDGLAPVPSSYFRVSLLRFTSQNLADATAVQAYLGRIIDLRGEAFSPALKVVAFIRLAPSLARLTASEVEAIVRSLPPETLGRVTGFLNAPRSAYSFSQAEVEALAKVRGPNLDEVREAARGRLQRGVDAAPVRAR